jgi:H+/gluconate symporter-like permease
MRIVKKVISTDNLPTRAPWSLTLLMILFYDKCSTDFMRGFCVAIIAMIWLIFFLNKIINKEVAVDIFETKENKQ